MIVWNRREGQHGKKRGKRTKEYNKQKKEKARIQDGYEEESNEKGTKGERKEDWIAWK